MEEPKLEARHRVSYLGQKIPRYLPDDVIAAMLYYVATTFEKRYFSGDARLIHTPLAELKRKGDTLLQKFPFSENDIFPFSRVLEDVLARLQSSRIIGMENPDFERYEIKTAAQDYVEREIISRFNDSEKEGIKKIAEYFAQRAGSE